MLLFFLSFPFISNLLAVASACTFSAFFQIISNFYMPSFHLLLKSAPSFSPMSSYPAQFPEFSGLSGFLPQMSVFVARGPLHFLCPQSSSCSLSINYFLSYVFSSSRKFVLLVHWPNFHTSVPYCAANIIFFF